MESQPREVRIRASKNINNFFLDNNLSFLVSSHENGQVIALGVENNDFSYHSYRCAKPMGIAVTPDRLLVVADDSIKYFVLSQYRDCDSHDIQKKLGLHFIASHSRYLGKIDCHEIAIVGDLIIFANTKFNCLSKVDDRFHFVPIWKPDFIDKIIYQDRCHLNGFTYDSVSNLGFFVTSHGQKNTFKSWNDEINPLQGCLLHSEFGCMLNENLSMPHSPRIWRDKVLFCNSGFGTLDIYNIKTGLHQSILKLPGFTRGLVVVGNYAVVGFSKARERSFFKNLPISGSNGNAGTLKCGLAVVDLLQFKVIHGIEFISSVNEILPCY